MTLVARCSNCASWRAVPAPASSHASASAPSGVCVEGLAPSEGALLCSAYRMSEAFRQKVVGAVLKDDPVRLELGRKKA